MTEHDRQVGTIDSATALTALLALTAAARDDAATAPEDRRKTEVVLADAGLSLAQISVVTGRKYESVKTTIRRSRAATATPRARAGKGTQASP